MSRYFDDFLFHSDDPYLMTEQNQYYGALTDEFIAHHGILGQKWGVRRFQNPDGSLTDEGRRRLGYDDNRVFKDGWKKVINEIIKNIGDQKLETAYYDKLVKEAKARWTDSAKSNEYKKDLNDTGGEEYARKLARASGLDQGDNWKMYRDALAGDERAQAIVEEWEWERKYERYLP